MSVTDPIADAATLIRNASNAGKEKLDVKASRIVEEILKILMREKFILNFKKIPDNKQGLLRVYLKYGQNKKPSITNIRKLSKPGLRIYRDKKNIPVVLGGLGVSIISTSKGILTDREAREKNLGGEVMLEVW